MAKNDPIDNLGAVAKSGSKASREAAAAGGGVTVTGQFRVGCRSADLLSDRVRVISKSKNYDDERCVWESGAGSSSTAEKDAVVATGENRRIAVAMREPMEDHAGLSEERRWKDLAEVIGFPVELCAGPSAERWAPRARGRG